MKAVILAGGFGTRLRDRVPDVPKPMAPVGGRPFLAHLLRYLQASTVVDHVVLSVGYRAEAIRAHFGNDFEGLPLSYAVEEEPLGTGGALALALRDAGEAPVLALNGDTFLQLDLPELVRWYDAQPEPLAMVLRHVDDAGRYGAIALEEGRVRGFDARGRSAPGWINSGLYVLQPTLFQQLGLTGKFSFEVDVLQRHCEQLRPRAFTTSAYFIDIGIPDDYDRANRELPELLS